MWQLKGRREEGRKEEGNWGPSNLVLALDCGAEEHNAWVSGVNERWRESQYWSFLMAGARRPTETETLTSHPLRFQTVMEEGLG